MQSYVVLAALAACASASEIALEHALGEKDEFRPRGTITVSPTASRNKLVRVSPSSQTLSTEEVARLRQVAQERGTYRLRARLGEGPWASTSVPICWLAAANFAESLEVQLDAGANVVSISYRNLAPSEVCAVPDVVTLESSVVASLDIVAQAIPVQIAAVRPPAGFAEPPPRDETQPERPVKKSFFARYWQIIVPVTLLFLTIKAEPPPQQQQGAQQQQSGAAASS